jgi:hypothetical protein
LNHAGVQENAGFFPAWSWCAVAFWLVATALEDRLSVPTHTSFAAAPIAEQSDL